MKLGIFRLSLLLIAILPFTTIAQRGKNLDYAPGTTNVVVNTYTAMTMNAVAGANTITVANNAMTNAVLTAPLAPGDLILIIQMQGIYMMRFADRLLFFFRNLFIVNDSFTFVFFFIFLYYLAQPYVQRYAIYANSFEGMSSWTPFTMYLGMK